MAMGKQDVTDFPERQPFNPETKWRQTFGQ
jgi:hypothetical protein